jgi:hypothetical protein
MLSQHPDLLAEELSNFIGSENFYKHLGGLHYTDGVKYLADNVELDVQVFDERILF